MNSTIAAKVMAGRPKIKENFAASFLFHPVKSAVEIVTPDLETPGKIANAWEKPTKKLSIYLKFLKFLKLLFELSATYINNDIKKETIAIERFERKIIFEKSGTNNFILPPRIMIGIVPIKIDFDNLLCNKKDIKFFDDWSFSLKKSFLKYQKTAKMLPSWIIADIEDPGSSSPKKIDITFKCAVLLTGINSVNPWISPYKMNSKYSKYLVILKYILIAI